MSFLISWKMNLTSPMQGKESNFKGSIVWANQEAAAILIRLSLVFCYQDREEVMQKAQAKLKQFLLGVARKIPILYFYTKRT